MKIKLHKGQYEVATDPHRFKVVCAGRRWGKSVLSRSIMLKWALDNQGLYWIVSPTYQQGKDIHWQQGYKTELPTKAVAKWNDSDLSVTLTNGSIIQLKSADTPDRLKGVKLRGLIVDEIASIRNWEWVWHEALRPTLTDYEAPAIFISTPRGFNHYYDLFQQGQKDDSLYKSWRFTSYDNPYIPKAELDQAKKELTDDTFAQEYMADFRKYTGLALQFQRDIHLIEPFDVPKEWQRGRGFDYGSNDPTASLRIAIAPDDTWYVERAYKQKGSVIKDHATTVLAQDYGLGFIPIFGDPSGDQWEKEFAQYGLNITPANKETGQNAQGWVSYQIEKINERLKPVPGHVVRLPDGRVINNAPRLLFLNTPEVMMAVKEAELLKWKETAQGQTIPILDEYIDPDGHSDLMACLRYFACSFEPPHDDEPIEDDELFDDNGFY